MSALEVSAMTSLESQWWFSPSKIADSFNDLLPGATRYFPNSEPIKKAASLSIHMRGAYVKESYDKDGRFSKKPGTTNDLLVVSNFQTGTAPTVQRVHYFKEKQKINEWIGNFFNTLVCSFTDFQDNHVTLQTQVYDVDSYARLKEIVSGLTSMAGNVAVTFPVVAPYVAAGGGVATTLLELVNQIDKHDKIIDSNMRLEITEEGTGSQLLQTGHWVYFEKPQMQGSIKLNSNLQIVDAASGRLFDGCSYVIYTIRKEEANEPNWEIDQKVAKLLSELNGKGNSGKAAIDFLRDTMEGYNKFKKLRRIQELEAKANNRTAEEDELLKKLKSDESLKAFMETTISKDAQPIT